MGDAFFLHNGWPLTAAAANLRCRPGAAIPADDQDGTCAVSTCNSPSLLSHSMSADPAESAHFDEQGRARMVDVSAKAVTVRFATAHAEITMRAAAADQLRERSAAKGDVLAVAEIAAIQACKLTEQLIPLCHSIPLEAVTVSFAWPESPAKSAVTAADSPTSAAPADASRLRCSVTVRTTGKTGVEMEAMTAASIGCLTVYDMLKSVDREMTIGPIWLGEKSGGRSGSFRRPFP